MHLQQKEEELQFYKNNNRELEEKVQQICIENEKLNQFVNEKLQEIAQLQDLEMKIQTVVEENEHVHKVFQ